MVRRKLGQHFLINRTVVQHEVAYVYIFPDETVLEIGSGKGILTQLLAQAAKQVIAVEIDQALIDQLQTWIPKNVTLISADILNIDFSDLPSFTKVVANLPFSISSPVTFKLLDYPFTKAILIYQKDFAQRMVATPGTKEYSRLSVNVYYKSYCKILENVSKESFFPSPRVDASIVELIPRTQPPFVLPDEKLFFEITAELFNHRRKKIKTTLGKKYTLSRRLPYADQRVEELTPEQIGEISTSIRQTL